MKFSSVAVALLSATAVSAQSSYTERLPKCIQNCFSSLIAAHCGSPDDWSCICSSGSSDTTTIKNFVTNPDNSACQSALKDCSVSTDFTATVDVTNSICMEVQSGKSGAASSLSPMHAMWSVAGAGAVAVYALV